MSIDPVAALFVASFIKTALPGPCFLLIANRAIREGLGAGLIVCAGILGANLVLIGVALALLGGVSALSPVAFDWMRWVAALALVGLALRLIAPGRATARTRGTTCDLAFGFVLGVTNPLNLVFMLAIVPNALASGGVWNGSIAVAMAIVAGAALAQFLILLMARAWARFAGKGRWIDYATVIAMLMTAALSAAPLRGQSVATPETMLASAPALSAR